ncbi:hypothetical protein MFLAVUS_005146 [Mucor flavus]|uniref:Uncharacterized protein n=1 Tax=Mucor flavus TaxID=439312 RepID=A0ABP9YXV7_9FUNG
MSARRVQRRNESLNMQFTLSIALWYLNKVLETIIQSRYFPQPKGEPNELISLSIYAGYLELMLQQKHISIRLSNRDKTKLLRIVTEMSRGEQENFKQQASKLLEQLQVLPFRKLKFSAKLFYDQDDLALVKKLKQEFGQEAILVIGNWSAPNVKFQESTRNKGLIKMLKKNGFEVYLIDEFRTSSFCSKCENRLEKFKLVDNPRPFQRQKMSTAFCLGLLQYEIPSC